VFLDGDLLLGQFVDRRGRLRRWCGLFFLFNGRWWSPASGKRQDQYA
jgi:hypothetical protein